MSSYRLQPREITLNTDYEVIVVGGGPSGCAAATAAAREGAKTLLIEQTGFLGGMATGALVNAWTPYSDGVRVLYGGLSERVFTEIKAKMPHVNNDATAWVPIDYETMKQVYDDMVTESGADILFHTMLCAVEMADQDTVDVIIVNNKAGLTAYRAKVYIDCTGDADLAVCAGAEYTKGDSEGNLQPATMCFMLSNVDPYGYDHTYGILHAGNAKSPIHAIIASGKYPLIPDNHICNDYIGPATMGFNAGHLWDVDNTDPVSVSGAMIS